jgi:hypothetical protein
MVGQMMENVDMETMMDEMVGRLEQQMEENMANGGKSVLNYKYMNKLFTGFEEMMGEMMAEGPLGEMMQSMDVSGGLEELMGNMEGSLPGPEMLSQLGNMEMNMKCSCSPVA